MNRYKIKGIKIGKTTNKKNCKNTKRKSRGIAEKFRESIPLV